MHTLNNNERGILKFLISIYLSYIRFEFSSIRLHAFMLKKTELLSFHVTHDLLLIKAHYFMRIFKVFIVNKLINVLSF